MSDRQPGPGIERRSGDTAARLTAVALLLRPMGPWYVSPVILAAAVLALVSPAVLRHSWTWAAITLMIAVRIAEDWPLADNHIYLLGYWTLAMALSRRASTDASFLSWNSRWLIGSAFAFAVIWKAVLSPDFLDGRFFRVTVLTDPRFGEAAQLVGGLPAEQLATNREALKLLAEGAELLETPAIHEPPRLRWFSAVSTWGILALEAAVALSMLLPMPGASSVTRHLGLLLFCGVTYLFAPVAGFGWLLLAMGVAQLAPGQVWLERAYTAGFLLVIFYDQIPWAALVVRSLRP